MREGTVYTQEKREGESEMALVAGWILIFIAVISIFALAVGILVLVAQWKVYKKAGERGWASLIPFYSQYVLVKITWGNGWLFLLYLIPIGNLIFAIATNIKLARVFGKGGGYAVGLIFLSFVFLPMLAFGNAEYQGPDEKKSRGAIIATVVTGVGYILLMIILTVTGVIAGYSQYQSSTVYIDEDDSYDDQSEADAVEDWEEEFYDQDGYDDYDSYDDYDDGVSADDYKAMEGDDDFIIVPLTDEERTVEVPVLKSEYLTVSDYSAVSMTDGIMTSLYMTYAYSDPSAVISELTAAQVDSMSDMSEYYTNVTVDEMITGDGFALQQINYDSINYDGTTSPCFDIVKCDEVDGSYVILMLTMDNSSATEETEELFRDACEVYGIDFQFD